MSLYRVGLQAKRNKNLEYCKFPLGLLVIKTLYKYKLIY